MRLKSESVSLVVAGKWPEFVLTPPWIAEHGFGLSAEAQQDLPATVKSVGWARPMLECEMPMVHYKVTAAALILSPPTVTDDALDAILRGAISILEQLPHTPVQAVGFNFGFLADDPAARMTIFRNAQHEALTAAPDGWEVTENKVLTSLVLEDAKWNVMQAFDGTNVEVALNLHMAASTVGGVIDRLRARPMKEEFAFAKALAASVLNEEFRDGA